MFDFTRLTRRQRIIMRNRTERLSDLLDWRNLNVYYKRARSAATEKCFPDVLLSELTLSISDDGSLVSI